MGGRRVIYFEGIVKIFFQKLMLCFGNLPLVEIDKNQIKMVPTITKLSPSFLLGNINKKIVKTFW